LNESSVDLDCRSQTEYYGPLYIGSQYIKETVIYDTMSMFTTVNLQDMLAQGFYSDYDIIQSTTAQEK